MEPKQPLGPPELPKSVKVPIQLEAPMDMAEPMEEVDEQDQLNEHVVSPGDPDGLVAAEEKRKWDAAHPPKSAPTPKKRHKRWPLILLLVIIIAAAAVGAYWFGSKQADKSNDHKTTQSGQAVKSESTTEQATPAKQIATKHYDSTNYTLSFDYPETWKISDTTTKLQVVSPAISLSTIDGSTVNGHVVFVVQNKQTTIAGYPESGAIAAIASKKLAYKQPTSIQRAQTYLSYLGYDKATALNSIYITGDNGYQQGQSVPMNNLTSADPSISALFQSCTSEDCATGTPTNLTLLASKWEASDVSKQLEAIIISLSLN